MTDKVDKGIEHTMKHDTELLRRLGDDTNTAELDDYKPVPGKHVRTDVCMRRETYDKLKARLEAAEKVCEELTKLGYCDGVAPHMLSFRCVEWEKVEELMDKWRFVIQ